MAEFSESQGLELTLEYKSAVCHCVSTQTQAMSRSSRAMHNYKPDEEDPSWRPHEAVVLLPSAAVYVLHQNATVSVSTDSTLT